MGARVSVLFALSLAVVFALLTPVAVTTVPFSLRLGAARPDAPLQNPGWPMPVCFVVAADCDDGTEKNAVWYPEGLTENLDYLGCNGSEPCHAGLRFLLPDFDQGDNLECVRLRLAAQGGSLAGCCTLTVRGVAEDSPEAFSQTRRPSVLPKTTATATWYVRRHWPSPGCSLAYYTPSPDIAPIINEILARPEWGVGAGGKAVALTIEYGGCSVPEEHYVRFEDSCCDSADPAIIEVCPTLRHTFIGKPILGRPTSNSITVNVISLVDIDI